MALTLASVKFNINRNICLKMKKILILLAIIPLVLSCKDGSLKNDKAYSRAKDEAALWTAELQKITPLEGRKLKVSFKYDPSMEELGQFAYSFDESHRLTLTSSDATGIMDALYTFCESLGITYDITGAMMPENVDWDKVVGTDSLITPHVRWRGIRQHVNFCMDISAYPMPLAKEYLQNLARMRFNKLVIHSYPFQWYEEDITGETNYAGSFFYGDVPRTDGWALLDSLCKPTNDSIFCIPGVEPVFNDVEKRSEFAMDWMRELITAAKETGLRVQFSCENRAFDVEQTKKLAYRITDLYPIDDLEFITEEMGGWNEDVEYATLEIDTAAQAIKELEADPDFKGRVDNLKLGIYCVVGSRIGGLYRHAREILPYHSICVLSQYASRRVAETYPLFITNEEDLKWTELYSWTEFDGQMFIQQNHVQGIDDLLSQMDATAPGSQHRSLLFNHWRTAENRTSIRYAAEATLMGGRHREEFYRDYASRLCMKDAEAFLAIQDSLEAVHSFNLDHHGNVGFPPAFFWDRLGHHVSYEADCLRHSSEAYLRIGGMITDLYEREDAGYAKEYLALLGNRVLCSKLYLDTVAEVVALGDIPDIEDGIISPADRKKINAISEECIAQYKQVLRIFAKQLPDRGCLGTMAAIWNGPIRGLMYQNYKYGGVPMEQSLGNDEHLDLPPLPSIVN